MILVLSDDILMICSFLTRVREDSLVIFRHDQLSYSYQGSGVALQGWLVALRDRFDLEGLEGDYRGRLSAGVKRPTG